MTTDTHFNSTSTIGFFIRRDSHQWWSATECNFLSRMMEVALRARSIFPEKSQILSKLIVIASLKNEAFAFVEVTDVWQGLRTIEAELDAIGLLRHAEIARRDYDELIWRPYAPKTPKISFENRCQAVKAWGEEINAIAAANEMLLNSLKAFKEMLPPSRPTL
jgi:hypothetical protein